MTLVTTAVVFNTKVREVLSSATTTARDLHLECVAPEHVLWAILQEPDCIGGKVLRLLDADFDQMQRRLEYSLHRHEVWQNPFPKEELFFRKDLWDVIRSAKEDVRAGAPMGVVHEATTGHLILGILQLGPDAASNALREQGLTLQETREKLQVLLEERRESLLLNAKKLVLQDLSGLSDKEKRVTKDLLEYALILFGLQEDPVVEGVAL